MKQWLWVCMALWAVPAAAADLFEPKEKQAMMALTLENFWGKAVDSEGKPVQPKNEKERATVPISPDQANYVIDKGAEAGLAQWCKVEWEPRFQRVMQQLRKGLSNDTQAAYAGALHGVAQQMMVTAMEGEPCDDATKQQISELIADDIKTLTPALAAK